MRRLVALSVCFAGVLWAPSLFAEDVVDHSTFGELLETYVDGEGQVAYGKWKENEEDLEKLKSYLESIAEAKPDEHSDEARLAFYLNAYNAYVLASIIDHWPTEGPQTEKGFFKVETHEVAGEETTLDDLEHGLIREEFDEPRIHFVLVCAAKSCPRLRTTPLTEQNLDSVLEEAAEEFIPKVTERKEGKIVTSRLFKWFSKDFEEAEGSVRAYLAAYTDGDVEEALTHDEMELSFREYDWSVNAQ